MLGGAAPDNPLVEVVRGPALPLTFHCVMPSCTAGMLVIKSCLNRAWPHGCPTTNFDGDGKVAIDKVHTCRFTRLFQRTFVNSGYVADLAFVIELRETLVLGFCYVMLCAESPFSLAAHSQTSGLSCSVAMHSVVLRERVMQDKQPLVRRPEER